MSAVHGKTREGLHICIDTDNVALAMYINHTVDVKYKSSHLPGQNLVFNTKKAAKDFYDLIIKHMGAGAPVEVGNEDVAKP